MHFTDKNYFSSIAWLVVAEICHSDALPVDTDMPCVPFATVVIPDMGVGDVELLNTKRLHALADIILKLILVLEFLCGLQ